MRRAASACARRSCRSRSTARATPSRRCSSRTICARGSAAEALSRAASSVFGVLRRTAEAGSREILLIEAQDEFVNPSRVFAAETDVRSHHAPPLRHARRVHDKRFAGNPLAVVLEPDGLDTAAMQTIAREFNLSETVFVLPPRDKAQPREAAHLHAGVANCRSPAIRPSAPRCCSGCSTAASQAREFMLEETSGRCRCQVTPAAATAAARSSIFRACRRSGAPRTTPRWRRRSALRSAISASTDCTPRAGRPAIRSPSCRCAGSMRSGAAASKPAAWNAAFGSDAHAAAYMFCRETAETGHHVPRAHVRAASGVPEDPATGSAAAAFAGLSGGARRLPRRRASRSASSRATRWAARARSSSR